jgi:DNA excision repair protein ERCC-2
LKKRLDIQKVIDDFYDSGNNIRDIKNTSSYIFVVGQFLDKWRNTFEESYARILKKDSKNITLSIRCLDPSVTSRNIIHDSYSTILMSGTLQPTTMYRDILGFDEERTVEKSFDNPFPKRNRLSIIVPKTTTKYEMRTPEQYKNIAKICADIINAVPGNSIIFFPSYDILKKVFNLMNDVRKTIILESSGMSRDEKFTILEKFKNYHETGACLLGVQSGSFSEGIDLPGDYLKAVVVIGLPLQKPNLETRQLINYFDIKFQKGWDYGYVFPAFSKILQSAGRCIRSEKDKGIIAFVDERYAWPNYIRCFPSDWEMKIDPNYSSRINEFFKRFE